MPEEVPLGLSAGQETTAPIVALTTDFGSSDPFAGLVKAGILTRCPAARIIDLTHAVPAYDVEAGAFWIERCYRYLPRGTIHVCVVDPGVGTARRILLVEQAGQLFLGPDNGLLSRVAGTEGAVVRGIGQAFLRDAGLGSPSATFHGRDLFAPLAGLLAAGACRPEDVGCPVSDWLRPGWTSPFLSAGHVHGRILIVDKFGNCFSNINEELLPRNEDLVATVGGELVPLVRTYGDRPPGSLVAVINSFGVLEVACVGEHAADRLGLKKGDPVVAGPAAPGSRPARGG